MKFKVGDKVRIVGKRIGDGWNSSGPIGKWLCQDMTIASIYEKTSTYKMKEDCGKWHWYEHMVEGLVQPDLRDLLQVGRRVVYEDGTRVFIDNEARLAFEKNVSNSDLTGIDFAKDIEAIYRPKYSGIYTAGKEPDWVIVFTQQEIDNLPHQDLIATLKKTPVKES